MKKKFLLTIIIFILLFSVAVIPTYAQDGTNPEATEEVAIAGKVNSGIGFLADALGTTMEELKARIDAGEDVASLYAEAGLEVPYFKVSTRTLAEALGITMEELQARIEAGEIFSDLHAEAGISIKGYAFNRSTKALAEALGITFEELMDRVKAGEKMVDLRKEAGFHPEYSNAGGLKDTEKGNNGNDKAPKDKTNNAGGKNKESDE